MLNGPMSRPSGSFALNPAFSAHGTIFVVIVSYTVRCWGVSASGSSRAVLPPRCSGSSVIAFPYCCRPTAFDGTSKAFKASDTIVNHPISVVTSTMPASPISSFAR